MVNRFRILSARRGFVAGTAMVLIAVAIPLAPVPPTGAAGASPDNPYLETPYVESPPVNAESLPGCAKNVVITSVFADGRHSVIQGVTRAALYGKTVAVQYMPTGKKIAGTATVDEYGFFAIRVPRPARPAPASKRARYRVIAGDTVTPWQSLTRRLIANSVRFSKGKIKVAGYVVLPARPTARVSIKRDDGCGGRAARPVKLATVKINPRTGRFTASIRVAGARARRATFINMHVKVLARPGSRRQLKAVSIPQPLVLWP
ncbi:MAG: hypothetical protein WAP37_09435 [Solirubrobacterales bacterium]